MNFFELFHIPVSLLPDRTVIKQKFYELSRRYHPDFFTNAAPDEQASALEMSSQINKGYKILQQPEEIIKYVLQLHNLLEEEEKYKLPGSFLGDMLELNEQLMEAKMEDDETGIIKVQQAIKDMETAIYKPVENIIANYQQDTTTKEELLQVKDYYYKKKYLRRILAGMQ